MDEADLKSLAKALRRNDVLILCVQNYSLTPEEIRAVMSKRVKRNVLLQYLIDPQRFELRVEIPFPKRNPKATRARSNHATGTDRSREAYRRMPWRPA